MKRSLDLEWKDSGTRFEYKWKRYSTNTRIEHQMSRYSRGGTCHDPRIPCTDSRYCFPVKRRTCIVERCINMRTYKRARRFFDRSKGTKVQRARRLFWLRVSLPAADPLCTIAHCIVLFYGTARCCGHGIADPWLDTPSPRCCILFGINLTGIMKFGV